MLKETKTEETRPFFTCFFIDGILNGGPGPPGPHGYAYDCNFNAICDIKILCACLLLCACQSDTNGSILYNDAKYVILLVKAKVVLNGSCNLKL